MWSIWNLSRMSRLNSSFSSFLWMSWEPTSARLKERSSILYSTRLLQPIMSICSIRDPTNMAIWWSNLGRRRWKVRRIFCTRSIRRLGKISRWLEIRSTISTSISLRPNTTMLSYLRSWGKWSCWGWSNRRKKIAHRIQKRRESKKNISSLSIFCRRRCWGLSDSWLREKRRQRLSKEKRNIYQMCLQHVDQIKASPPPWTKAWTSRRRTPNSETKKSSSQKCEGL